jgi:hypothetical protein
MSKLIAGEDLKRGELVCIGDDDKIYSDTNRIIREAVLRSAIKGEGPICELGRNEHVVILDEIRKQLDLLPLDMLHVTRLQQYQEWLNVEATDE